MIVSITFFFDVHHIKVVSSQIILPIGKREKKYFSFSIPRSHLPHDLVAQILSFVPSYVFMNNIKSQ
jgi:hypothetical protein